MLFLVDLFYFLDLFYFSRTRNFNKKMRNSKSKPNTYLTIFSYTFNKEDSTVMYDESTAQVREASKVYCSSFLHAYHMVFPASNAISGILRSKPHASIASL